MIRILLVTVLIIFLSSASYARKLVAEGKTHTAFGNYKIELADDPVTMKGHDCKAYVISYENTPMEVTVVVCKDRKCKRYVVISDKLAVQYVCNAKYFGVELLNETFKEEGLRTSPSALNREQYFHQKKIWKGQGSELENTGLIAAYFPMLLNDSSEILARK
jgi:hypothetical protein